jgi:hypothetical protein
MRKYLWIVPVCLLLAGLVCSADEQPPGPQESLAELARRTRAENAKRKAAKVYTNEDIPRGTGGISVVGGPTLPAKPATPGASPHPSPSAGPPSAPSSTSKKEQHFREEMGKLKAQLELHQRELAVLQQQENLNQLQYYPNPYDTLQQEYSRSDINKRAQAIEEKKQQIAEDEKAIADLEEQYRREGGNPAELSREASALPAGSASDAAAPPADKAAPGNGGARTKEYWQARFQAARQALAVAKEQLQLAENELNLMQVQQAREMNAATQAELAQRIPQKQAEVEEKREAVAKAQQALDDLQKEFDASGAPPDWSQSSGS